MQQIIGIIDGGPNELYNFAVMLDKGQEVNEDKKEAIQYYKKVADHGYSRLKVKHKALKKDMN